jgi:hypothetical protein
MSGQQRDFATLKSANLIGLAALVPQLASHAATTAVDMATSLCALAKCRLSVTQRANDVAPRVSCVPSPRKDRFARQIIGMIHESIEEPLHGYGNHAHFSLEMMIDQGGFVELVTTLVEARVGLDGLQDLAREIGQAVKALGERVDKLVQQHFAAIMQRDLPFGAKLRTTLTPAASWALASELSTQSHRPIVLERRRQALESYGAIESALRDEAISDVVDRGEPLARALCAKLGLTDVELRRLRGVRSITTSIEERGDHVSDLVELKAHSVPLHEWPAAGQWQGSVWHNPGRRQLLRPDYLGTEAEPRDALAALVQDLLEPLAATRAAHLRLTARHNIINFLRGLEVPSSLANAPVRCDFLTALRNAIVGPRGIKSFREGIALWHRRAATVAALRHEENAEQPGWPALCARWSSSDNVHQFVPLTSAADLVEEGNALGHCVGGYYSQCRSGGTQILSLRSHGRHAATLELLLGGEPGQGLTISVGQFRTFGNARPNEPSHVALRAFMDDLRSGAHPIARTEIGAYRKRMAKSGDYSWRGTPLPLDHARKAWPLYRPMLPRGTPDSFDEWCIAAGLGAAFDRILTAVAFA